jgi:hypothetical protein
LRLVELSFVLEEAFTLEQITAEEAGGIDTVGDIEAFILGKLDERGFTFVDDDPSVALAVVAEAESWVLPD